MAEVIYCGEVGAKKAAPRTAAKFKPATVKFFNDGRFLTTVLKIDLGHGKSLGIADRLDLHEIEQALRTGHPQVSGFFGSLWKGIKKTVKTVGKATGLSKVIKAAKSVLKNPLISSALGAPLGIPPGVISSAVNGLDAMQHMSTAHVAKAAGKPELAKKLLARASEIAKKVEQQSPGATPLIEKEASRIYRLIISPE